MVAEFIGDSSHLCVYVYLLAEYLKNIINQLNGSSGSLSP